MTISTMTQKLSFTTLGVSFIAIGIAIGGQQAQASTLFNDRIKFENQLNNFIIDDYENPNYLKGDIASNSFIDIHTNASMNSVFGETKYKTTTPFGVNGYNIIYSPLSGNHAYCAGCNGSFLLDFTQTTVSNALGVFGAGFDILFSTEYFAYVTFGDDSTKNFSLGYQTFWGITSEKSIKTVHVGLKNGGSTINGSIVIDNLTIGAKSVPEPASVIGLLALGGFGATSLSKRKRQQNAIVKG